MKKSKSVWNYLDLLLQFFIIIAFILGVYFLAEHLEKYIYRYTVFPFVAVFLVFVLGILMGRGIERTKKNKPIGIISRAMAKSRKRTNKFIFSDTPNSYVSNKEIIEDIKSGDIVHVKHFEDDGFGVDDFNDIYKVQMDEIVDNEMEEKEKKE